MQSAIYTEKMQGMEKEDSQESSMEWTRTELFIEGKYYPSFETKGDDWCYSIHPMVRPKWPEPIGYHFGGWSKKSEDAKRHRIQGDAKSVGECTSMCQAHFEHISSRR